LIVIHGFVTLEENAFTATDAKVATESRLYRGGRRERREIG